MEYKLAIKCLQGYLDEGENFIYNSASKERITLEKRDGAVFVNVFSFENGNKEGLCSNAEELYKSLSSALRHIEGDIDSLDTLISHLCPDHILEN